MKVGFSYVLLFFIYSIVYGQYDHTDIFPGLESDELYDLLNTQFKPTAVKSYTEARHFMYREVYNTADSVETIYAGLKRYLDPSVEDPIQFLLQGANNIQVDTEHSYPRSKGAERNTDAGSDLHHLFPSRKQINASRANLPFGEVVDQSTINWYVQSRTQQSIPSTDINAYSELGQERFEPREGQKGNIARAIFYFYTMYRSEADNADPQFFDVQKDDLCNWHFEDPVDSLEWVRSKMIGSFQGHEANPFVLDCSLAARLYCDEITDACAFLTSLETIDKNQITLYPNPTHNIFNLQLKEYGHTYKMELALFDQMGKKLLVIKPVSTEIVIDMSGYSPGLYFLWLLEKGKIKGRKKIVKL